MCGQPPKPFESESAQPSGRQRLRAGKLVDGSPDCGDDRNMTLLRQMRGDSLLQRHPHADEQDIRSKSPQLFGHRIGISVAPGIAGNAATLQLRPAPAEKGFHRPTVGPLACSQHSDSAHLGKSGTLTNPIGGPQPAGGPCDPAVPQEAADIERQKQRHAIDQHQFTGLVEPTQLPVGPGQIDRMQIMTRDPQPCSLLYSLADLEEHFLPVQRGNDDVEHRHATAEAPRGRPAQWFHGLSPEKMLPAR